jgi:hypothetical protein
MSYLSRAERAQVDDTRKYVLPVLVSTGAYVVSK